MPLYKYVTAERIDVLQNGFVRFSQPSALNDPDEMRPHVERLFTDNDLRAGTGPRGIMAVGHRCILRVYTHASIARREPSPVGACGSPAWFTFVTVRRRSSQAPG
jgi:hypothetical protein